MNSVFSVSLRRGFVAVFSALALAAAAPLAHADQINVVNGGFETLSNPGVSSGFGSLYPSQTVVGWTTSGYNFVFTPGTADTTGANGPSGNVKLWGPGDGSNNGLPSTSPLGGNYLALDGAYETAAVSQVISGLTIGDLETVSFYYAGAQQQGFTGPTTEALKVSLGGQTLETPILQDASHGFTGWQQESLTFTATSTSETLSFLAVGTPSGVPPMTLLDGVSVNQTPVPEPESLALFATGLLGMGGMVRRRFMKS